MGNYGMIPGDERYDGLRPTRADAVREFDKRMETPLQEGCGEGENRLRGIPGCGRVAVARTPGGCPLCAECAEARRGRGSTVIPLPA